MECNCGAMDRTPQSDLVTGFLWQKAVVSMDQLVAAQLYAAVVEDYRRRVMERAADIGEFCPDCRLSAPSCSDCLGAAFEMIPR